MEDRRTVEALEIVELIETFKDLKAVTNILLGEG